MTGTAKRAWYFVASAVPGEESGQQRPAPGLGGRHRRFARAQQRQQGQQQETGQRQIDVGDARPDDHQRCCQEEGGRQPGGLAVVIAPRQRPEGERGQPAEGEMEHLGEGVAAVGQSEAEEEFHAERQVAEGDIGQWRDPPSQQEALGRGEVIGQRVEVVRWRQRPEQRRGAGQDEQDEESGGAARRGAERGDRGIPGAARGGGEGEQIGPGEQEVERHHGEQDRRAVEADEAEQDAEARPQARAQPGRQRHLRGPCHRQPQSS